MNRLLGEAVLAGVFLTFTLGPPTASAAAPAPPPEAITTGVDQAPAGAGVSTFALAGMQRVLVLSCQPSTDRPAWAVPSTPAVVAWLAPPVAYISGTVPLIDTSALGWPVELVALGGDGPLSVPVFRSGCFENRSGPRGAGQAELRWGDPAQISSTEATGLKIINPASRPTPGAALAVLPGAAGTTAPALPTTTPSPAATTPAPGGGGDQGAATPDYSAPPGQTPADSGGGTPWGAIIFGILTLLFAAASRLTSWRVRVDEDADKLPLRAHLYGGAAALTGLIAAAYAPASAGGFLVAAVLAVIVALVLSAQRAASAGYRVSLVALARTARTEWPAAGTGAGIGYLIGYLTGSGAASPAALYGVLAGAAIGIGAAHLRQTHARVAGWRVDAAVVADILGVPEKAITETGEVVFATTAEGGFVVTALHQAARAHLDGIEERCAAVAPHLMVTHADRTRVEVGPVDAETAAHREAVAGSGGLVGGTHTGADPWTPAASAANSVDTRQPKPAAGAGPDALDLSRGWD